MDDSFKVRVDRAFGSLDASSSSSIKSTPSSLSSLWCLTDEEIERNRWIQDKVTHYKDKDEEHLHRLKNPKPYSSFLQGLLAQPSTSHQDLESDIQDLDDEDNSQQPQLCKPDDHTNEEWSIRSSVGMDCTLDNEEEEDAIDKVASGREEPAERFYMRDVNDYEVDIDSNIELPDSLTDVIKDPRANHMAAKLRLKEDEESARKLGLQNEIQEDGDCLKSSTESKKRVCFEEVTGEGGDVVMNEAPAPAAGSSVPDYVRNPSKYTHYTFDSMDDVDEESNRKAYTELFNLLRGSSGSVMETQHDDSPTSIIFMPKKKSSGGSVKKSKVDGYKKVVPISIGSEDSLMEEEEPEPEPEIASSRLRKGGRRYRTTGSGDVE